jgi:predicted N-formylglutamate amidohydrolase
VAYHNNARAFKDLAEFFDQLFFLCSIHSFTPNLGITPRLN